MAGPASPSTGAAEPASATRGRRRSPRPRPSRTRRRHRGRDPAPDDEVGDDMLRWPASPARRVCEQRAQARLVEPRTQPERERDPGLWPAQRPARMAPARTQCRPAPGEPIAGATPPRRAACREHDRHACRHRSEAASSRSGSCCRHRSPRPPAPRAPPAACVTGVPSIATTAVTSGIGSAAASARRPATCGPTRGRASRRRRGSTHPSGPTFSAWNVVWLSVWVLMASSAGRIVPPHHDHARVPQPGAAAARTASRRLAGPS